MDRYKCRLCFKSFINGRALGGHMRSHMLYEEEREERTSQLNDDDTESDACSSSSDEEEQDHDNPKRSRRLQIVDDDGSEFESESDSAKINPTRRRSKRTRKLGSFHFELKSNESVTEPDHYSSASDTTTEKDLAICLIMLSRDKWKQQKKMEIQYHKASPMETDDEGEDYRSSKIKGRGRFKCETCGKLFKSYQALGGHRASHKKNKTITKTEQVKTEYENGVTEKKIHECPICFRVFSSGQALGGHKRSHGTGLSVNQSVRIHKEEKQRIIDLNLPAPNEEDESSVVFDEW